jgi:hypothetical protein
MSDDARNRINEELSPEESRALDAWTAPAPPPDLVQQVLARAQGARIRRSFRLRRAAIPVALTAGLLLVVGGWAVWRGQTSSVGEAEVAQRTTLDLGRRAVAVAEPGSRLAWRVSGDGSARVEQRNGDVFYRVDRGAVFEVSTPQGTATVLGTCFRVEVKEMRASRAGLAGAAAGAALAAVVVVTVYEGRVLTASPRGRMELGAGEAARIEANVPPRRIALQPAVSRETPSAAEAAELAGLSRAELQTRSQQLSAEVSRLRDQLRDLDQKGRPPEGQKDGPRGKYSDFTKDELLAMAKRCEVRWEMPPLGTEPYRLDEKRGEEVGINRSELPAVNKVLAEHHRQVTQQIRALYLEVTGDTKGADALSPSGMISEIDDKSNGEERRAMYQRLAEERAGLRPPPPDLAAIPAVERLYRLLAGVGDRLEQAIGAEIGPDLARRIRESHGFPSRYIHSGCPQ